MAEAQYEPGVCKDCGATYMRRTPSPQKFCAKCREAHKRADVERYLSNLKHRRLQNLLHAEMLARMAKRDAKLDRIAHTAERVSIHDGLCVTTRGRVFGTAHCSRRLAP